MSQMNQNEATKAYHRPQLKKLGNVSELTQTNSFSGSFSPTDGGTFFNQYGS